MNETAVRTGLQVDEWVWGTEKIVWGFDPSHKYTFKIIEPRRGRSGCMSLQYHHAKSETWLVIRGIAWGLVVAEDQVCTRLMRPGDIQNLPTGYIHRLMGVTADVQVVEPSTPDAHAADKTVPKDVVRLHCVLGREVSLPRNTLEAKIIEECVRVTEEAITAIERNELPKEYNLEILGRHGALRVD
jgi:mannose-6-phosphate isomerase-like protein (cupin superfamily)